jgi:Recombination endonuclease VII
MAGSLPAIFVWRAGSFFALPRAGPCPASRRYPSNHRILQVTDRNERRRQRYADDPEYRQRMLSACKASRKRNKKKINAKRRLRWATDADSRERGLRSNRAYHSRNKHEINAKKRLRWVEDADFRDRILTGQRAYRKRNKLELSAKQRLRWATDPDYRKRKAKSDRAWSLICKYGITIEQYNVLYAKQKGRCAICEKKKPKCRLYVDHCHLRKFIRRLLCQKCNSGLGFFGDDLRLVRRAAAYLAWALKPKPRPARCDGQRACRPRYPRRSKQNG